VFFDAVFHFSVRLKLSIAGRSGSLELEVSENKFGSERTFPPGGTSSF
jgi:hypothetical protein